MSAIAVPMAGRALARLERVRPSFVIAALISLEWLVTLGVALTVHHNGWIYYQGTDQLRQYDNAWLLAHGHAPAVAHGLGWSVALLPLALAGGTNLVSVLPFVVLVNVLVLMPLALASMVAVGRRLGGVLAGYWLGLLWVLVPLVGIAYTATGYHQRYTEFLLPQTLGLTASSAFPSMVLLAVATALVVASDALLAGVVAGAALAVDTANAPFLVGAALALAAARRWRDLMRFALGVAPFFVVLLVWTVHGLGLLPHVDASWHVFSTQLAGLQEHFWSARVLEWLPVAGAVGLWRRSPAAALLAGGWFACVLVTTWANAHGGTVDDTTVLQHTIPAIPAAVLLLAAIPLIVPGAVGRLRPVADARSRLPRAIGVVGLAWFVVLPLALAVLPELAASERVSFSLPAEPGFQGQPAALVDSGWRPSVSVARGVADVRWPTLHALGGSMSYLVLRSKQTAAPICTTGGGGAACGLPTEDVIPVGRDTTLQDRPPAGEWTYRIAAVASWVGDPTRGEVYVLSDPAG